MTGIIPNDSEALAIGRFVGKTAQENFTLKLYKSNTTPADASVTADFTESTFTGYSAATLTMASWTVTQNSGTTPSVASYAEQTFTSSANQTAELVYGYFIVGATSGKLIAAEKFATAVSISNLNDKVSITPSLSGLGV